MRRWLFAAVIAVAGAVSPVHAGDEASARLEKANEAYYAEDYQAAAEAYQRLITEDGIADAVLFFNAGNAAYRLNDIGRAVLNYRRALAVDPEFADAARNLKFLEEKTGLEFHDGGWLPPWISGLGTTRPLIVASALLWMGLLAILWRLKGDSGRRLATTLGIVFLLLAALAGSLFSVILAHSPGRDDFVIVEESAPLRTSPSDSAATAATLTGGEAVRRMQESGDWAYVSSGDSQPGWIRKEAMASVIPE